MYKDMSLTAGQSDSSRDEHPEPARKQHRGFRTCGTCEHSGPASEPARSTPESGPASEPALSTPDQLPNKLAALRTGSQAAPRAYVQLHAAAAHRPASREAHAIRQATAHGVCAPWLGGCRRVDISRQSQDTHHPPSQAPAWGRSEGLGASLGSSGLRATSSSCLRAA